MSEAEQEKDRGMTQQGDLAGLSMLGEGKTVPSRSLETFPNRHPDRNYVVTLASDEFTCLCPLTGQPDFATITMKYIPGPRIVESKSLKLYLWSYRNEGVFHEHVTNVILEDLVDALEPRWCEVTADFSVRGGIGISITVDYSDPAFVD
jgi:7-cyano-7-deazaguanine reductase